MVTSSVQPNDINRRRIATGEVFFCPRSMNLVLIPSGNVCYLRVYVLEIQVEEEKEEEEEGGDREEKNTY